MGMLLNLLTLPVSGPLFLVSWVGETLLQEAQRLGQEEESRLRGELMELQLRQEMGELTPEERALQEAALLERLEALRRREN